jgi:hypothetical protein
MADEEYQADAPRKTTPRRKPDVKVQAHAPPDRTRRITVTPIDDEDDDRVDVRRKSKSVMETMIPTKNPLALIAYYLGVFSLIPFLGNFIGPFAIILGILGANYARKEPTAGGMGHAITGIVLGIVATVGWWIAAVLWKMGVIVLQSPF